MQTFALLLAAAGLVAAQTAVVGTAYTTVYTTVCPTPTTLTTAGQTFTVKSSTTLTITSCAGGCRKVASTGASVAPPYPSAKSNSRAASVVTTYVGVPGTAQASATASGATDSATGATTSRGAVYSGAAAHNVAGGLAGGAAGILAAILL